LAVAQLVDGTLLVNMGALIALIVFLFPPIICAARFGVRGCIIGLLVSWILFGLCVEMSWVSCRPGFEPLRSPWAFCIGLPIFAFPWFIVFSFTKLAVMLIRHLRGKRGGKNGIDAV